MSTIVGNYNKGGYTGFWVTQGQQGTVFTIPSAGTLTRLGALLSASGGVNLSTKLCVWDASSGTLLGQTAAFNVPFNIVPGRFEADLTSPVTVTAGQTVVIGDWFAYNGGFSLVHSLSSGATRYKGTGSPSAMTGYSTDSSYQMAAYAYLTPVAAPNKPTVENYGVVTSTTPTIRAYVTTPDGRAIDSVQFDVSGVSPSHAKVYVPIQNGPWASGTWVSYTINPSDLGWTPAAGDTLTYGCAAGNGGGWTGSDPSPVFTINSTSLPTITKPTGTNHIPQHYVTADIVGIVAAWTFNDPQGEAQSAYQVRLYADSTGSKGALLTGADTGKVSSVAARTVNISPTASLVSGTYYWVGIQTWDVHDQTSGEATLRFKAGWGRYDGAHDIGAAPTGWSLGAIGQTLPANTNIVMEWGSNGGTVVSYPPATWYSSFAAVPLARFLHYRAYLFGWGSASPNKPTLTSISLTTTSATGVSPDGWTASGAQCSLDMSVAAMGTQSIKITGNGGNALRTWSQTVTVVPKTDYVIGGRIRFTKVGTGSPTAYIDLFDGTNAKVATNAISATTDPTKGYGFVQVSSPVYHTGDSQTSLTFRCILNDVTGDSGTTAWFDMVQLVPGTVLTAYSPGPIGKTAVLDRGGLMINAANGATMRLIGSTGGAYDIVELGAHGLKFNGDGEITRGSTFPSAPATNHLHYKTNLGMWFFYDGSRWASVEVVPITLVPSKSLPGNLSATTTSVLEGGVPSAPLGTRLQMLVTGIDVRGYANAVNDGSNYWTILTRAYPSTSTIKSLNTSALSSGGFALEATSDTAILPTTDYYLYCDATKTGTPGNLDLAGVTVLARWIAT